jgi:hypothetical protein
MPYVGEISKGKATPQYHALGLPVDNSPYDTN